MSQTNYTPIALYNSTTAAAVPVAGNLVDGELAVNITDGKLYYKDNLGAVKLLASNAAAGGTFAAPVVIEGTTTDAALRITQLGTGNALLVEDSTNPDASPLVVNADGRLILGTTSANNILVNSKIQVSGTAGDAFVQAVRFSGASTGDDAGYLLGRSNGTSFTSRSAVIAESALGSLFFIGDDGTNWVQGAKIQAFVDGTPGTNDMPGRLVFSTTADGASSTTERMRIDSAGRIGIGATAGGDTSILSGKNITGSTVAFGFRQLGSIQSDVTSQANGIQSSVSTAAASFTLTNLRNFFASPGTIGAGSSVTSQFGFFADSGLTGATNNYGFYGNIAAGTNRYNLYMSGTADNYMAGLLGIGVVPTVNAAITLGKAITGGTSAYGQIITSTIQSDVTVNGVGFLSSLSTQAIAFTAANVRHFQASALTIGAGSAVTTQVGLNIGAFTGATNNYGIQSGIAAATNAYNLYMSGTANNYMAGSLGIGTATLTGYVLHAGKSITGGAFSEGIVADGPIQSDVTSRADMFFSAPSVQAASFTLTALNHYFAYQNAIGAGASVTIQAGFNVAAELIGATNNYGFFGNIPAGTNRYNLYMAGTADNYMAGRLGIGANTGSVSFYNARNITGNTISYANYSQATIQSDVTSQAFGYRSALSTQASAFTLGNIFNFYAGQGTIGATSAVTNQYGFIVDSSLTGAANNYGFYGDIASGAGRWNLYMNGTAANFLGGQLQLGQDYVEKTNVANTSTAITLNLANGTFQVLTLTGSPTITMPTAVAGKSFVILLKTGTGSFTVTWSTVKWPGGTAPTITSTASKQDIFSFFSDGTNWYGTTVGQNYTP